MKVFDQSLLASISAPAFVGPKHLMPSGVRASTMPLASGSSGPTTTNSISFSLHHFAIACERYLDLEMKSYAFYRKSMQE